MTNNLKKATAAALLALVILTGAGGRAKTAQGNASRTTISAAR